MQISIAKAKVFLNISGILAERNGTLTLYEK